MNDAVERAAAAAAKIEALQKERENCLAEASAHEADARTRRARASACKTEIAEWATALNTYQVKVAVDTAQQAAVKSQQSAEANEKKTADTLAEVEKMKADLAEMLAKVKPE